MVIGGSNTCKIIENVRKAGGPKWGIRKRHTVNLHNKSIDSSLTILVSKQDIPSLLRLSLGDGGVTSGYPLEFFY